MARRITRQQRRQRTKYGSWAATALLAALAWWSGHLQVWLLPLLFWAYYELCLCPTLCGIQTTKGGLCRNPASGRLYACKAQPSHSRLKNDAFLRMFGLRRRTVAPEPVHGPQHRIADPEFMPDSATIESSQTLIVLLIALATLAGIVLAAIV